MRKLYYSKDGDELFPHKPEATKGLITGEELTAFTREELREFYEKAATHGGPINEVKSFDEFMKEMGK